MTDDYDLIIVGGGLVGASLAIALDGLPLRVALIESIPDQVRIASSAGDRALAISWGSAQILDQLRIWQGVAATATPIRQIHVSDRGFFGKTRLSARHEGVDALGYVISARDLEKEACRVLAQTSVNKICPADVISVVSGHDSVHVSIKAGGVSKVMSARMLAGADGSDSVVRRCMEIAQQKKDYGQVAIVCEVETSRPNCYTAYERFTSTGPLAMLPAGKRKSAVVWTLTPDEAEEKMALPEAAFCEALQNAFGYWLGELQLVNRRVSFPLQRIRAVKMVADRVVLVGNASHQVHPVAGQGLNLGLRDVAVLAEMLLHQTSFAVDIGERSFLEKYAKSRKADLDEVMGFTDTMVRLFSNKLMPLSLPRTLGLTALDLWGGARSALARRAMGLKARLPRFV
jgi:2-octaprenyl-6-methoxyphenol hydroxylase